MYKYIQSILPLSRILMTSALWTHLAGKSFSLNDWLQNSSSTWNCKKRLKGNSVSSPYQATVYIPTLLREWDRPHLDTEGNVCLTTPFWIPVCPIFSYTYIDFIHTLGQVPPMEVPDQDTDLIGNHSMLNGKDVRVCSQWNNTLQTMLYLISMFRQCSWVHYYLISHSL